MKTNWKKLRALRLERGLTQSQLAAQVGLSLRTVKESERKGGGTLRVSTARQIAFAYNVSLVEVLADFAGVQSEHEIPRFLLQQTLPRAAHDVMEILREGAVADMSNDFATARARFEEALQTVPSGDLDGKAHIIIRCATALDNNRNSVEALSLLRPLLEEKQWHVLQPKIVKWLKYHVALAHRRIAESLEINDDVVTGNLDTADVLFKEVESTGETGQRIAATHQLGCVLWVRAAKAYAVRERTTLLEKAQGCFRQAAKKWQAAGNFREGYALRRLAEIAESQGEHVRAHNLLLDALEVFVRHDCYRYRDEVRRHLDRLVRAMSGTPLE